MNMRPGLRRGFVAGVINIILVLLGLTGLAGTIVGARLGLQSQAAGAWLLLTLVTLWGGSRAVREAEPGSWRSAFLAGVVAGASGGGLMAAFTGVAGTLVASGAKIRQWLAQLTPDAVGALTLGHSPGVAAVVMFAAMTLAGVVGALLAYASMRYRWQERLSDRWRALREGTVIASTLRGVRTNEVTRPVLYVMSLLILFTAPFVLGQYWNYTLGTVGIYVILGLGLNIVVGLAGLLDLGYVAFFAIGAYTVALLTAPEPHGIMLNFWIALVVGVLLTIAAGVLLCIPVLRTRGDYLAIVTLGFGEIIRILSKSDVLTDFTGGPKGVRDIGGPSLFGLNINNEFYFMYIIILGILLVAFITYRLQHSRVGRAWMAMREDEDVAQAMGIHTLKYKILAFAIGAGFAGLGGVISASRNKFAGPEDFTLLVSINVLCLVIVGGTGSIPGVVLGALVLKGLPEMLRELDDYRFLAFGALLVVMMILRPEGLWPSARSKVAIRESGSPPDE